MSLRTVVRWSRDDSSRSPEQPCNWLSQTTSPQIMTWRLINYECSTLSYACPTSSNNLFLTSSSVFCLRDFNLFFSLSMSYCLVPLCLSVWSPKASPSFSPSFSLQSQFLLLLIFSACQLCLSLFCLAIGHSTFY